MVEEKNDEEVNERENVNDREYATYLIEHYLKVSILRPDTDIFEYWHEFSKTMPNFTNFAKKYLSCPPTSA